MVTQKKRLPNVAIAVLLFLDCLGVSFRHHGPGHLQVVHGASEVQPANPTGQAGQNLLRRASEHGSPAPEVPVGPGVVFLFGSGVAGLLIVNWRS